MWKRLNVALLAAAMCTLPPHAPCFAAPAAVRADPTARPRIEVAFVLDATGSMGSFIEDARTRIRAVAAELASGEPRPDVRFALVGFRDKGDAFVTRITPFTADVSVMHAALTELQADGGGDTPEAVLEAVRDGLEKLKWSPLGGSGGSAGQSPVLRLMYVVGDAPPQRYPDSPDEARLLELALKKGISIQSIVCGEPGPSGRAFFERIAVRTEGRSVSLADAGTRAATRAAGGPTAAGRPAPTSVGRTISGTTRTLAADTLRVDFAATARAPVTVGHLAPPAVGTSGLKGAQLRHVTDAATFSDLWRAHTSLQAGPSPAPPAIDFAKQHVLVVGGSDAGLTVESVREDEARGVRVATVRPSAPGLRFYIVPAAAAPVVAVAARAAGEEE